MKIFVTVVLSPFELNNYLRFISLELTFMRTLYYIIDVV